MANPREPATRLDVPPDNESMRSRLSDRLTVGRTLAVLMIVAWFVAAYVLYVHLSGVGFGPDEDAAARLHVDLVWAGVLVGVAVAGIAAGLVGDSVVAVVVSLCLLGASLFAVAMMGSNDNRLQQQPPTPVPTACVVYSGGHSCPGG